MPIITLTTDLGTKDHYLARLKIAIYRGTPETTVMDISHDIDKFNITQAGFVIRNIYREFPPGTVHLLGVRPEADVQSAHLIVHEEDQYFLSADNGIFTFIFDHVPEEVYEINISQDTDDLTFPTKDVLGKVAIHLAKGGTPEIVAKASIIKNNYTRLMPITSPDSLKGHIVHIDSYENVITNISRKMFADTGRGRSFKINFRRENLKVIHRSYNAVGPGEAVAIFGIGGFLELAINQGNSAAGGGAASLFGLKVDDLIRIDFA